MTNNQTTHENDEGLDAAKKIAEEEEGVARKPKGPTKWVVPVIGVIWSLFQLSIASWWILDTIFIRAIHLGFALLMVYLNYPVLKKPASVSNFFPLKIEFLPGIL